MLFKTIFQVLLVVVTSLLKTLDVWAHGISFTLVFAAFTLLTYKLQPFNYQRCNLWEMVSLVGVLWISALATISNIKEPNNLI